MIGGVLLKAQVRIAGEAAPVRIQPAPALDFKEDAVPAGNVKRFVEGYAVVRTGGKLKGIREL